MTSRPAPRGPAPPHATWTLGVFSAALRSRSEREEHIPRASTPRGRASAALPHAPACAGSGPTYALLHPCSTPAQAFAYLKPSAETAGEAARRGAPRLPNPYELQVVPYGQHVLAEGGYVTMSGVGVTRFLPAAPPPTPGEVRPLGPIRVEPPPASTARVAAPAAGGE